MSLKELKSQLLEDIEGFKNTYTCDNCDHEIDGDWTFEEMEDILDKLKTFDEIKKYIKEIDGSLDCGTCYFYYYPIDSEDEVFINIKLKLENTINTFENIEV